MKFCWDEDLRGLLSGEESNAEKTGDYESSSSNSDWMRELYASMLLPVGLPVGVVAGASVNSFHNIVITSTATDITF